MFVEYILGLTLTQPNPSNSGALHLSRVSLPLPQRLKHYHDGHCFSSFVNFFGHWQLGLDLEAEFEFEALVFENRPRECRELVSLESYEETRNSSGLLQTAVFLRLGGG